jgi:hypothetical protein
MKTANPRRRMVNLLGVNVDALTEPRRKLKARAGQFEGSGTGPEH